MASATLVTSCGRAEVALEDVRAAALSPVALPDAGPSFTDDGDGDSDGAGDDGPALFTFEPAELMVYRSTSVQLRATAPEAGATCSWNFGDGSPPEEGCAVSHTFHGGLADQRVTLTVTSDGRSALAMRTLPLERLPVSAGRREEPEPGAIPARPPKGDTNFRVLFLADLAGGSEAELATVGATTVELAPELVVVVGGAASPDAAAPWEAIRKHLSERLMAARIPVLWGVSGGDIEAGAEVRRPMRSPSGDVLDLADGERFPERWSLAYGGAYFAFISGAQQSDDNLDWLRARLAEAQVYESRIVVSYLPLHPFSDGVTAERGTLGPKFKVFELLLRSRTTVLVSAGQRAYFKGRYGALPVVSVGAATGRGERLAGHDFEQAPSLVVMDVEKGVPTRVFALEGPGYDTVLDEGYLPENVEVYTH